MNAPQLIFFVLLIILLVLSAIIISITSKVYIGNAGIKRGGTELTIADINRFLNENGIQSIQSEIDDGIIMAIIHSTNYEDKETFDGAILNNSKTVLATLTKTLKDLTISLYKATSDIGQTSSSGYSSSSSSSSSSGYSSSSSTAVNPLIWKIIELFPDLSNLILQNEELQELIIENQESINELIQDGDLYTVEATIISLNEILVNPQNSGIDHALQAGLNASLGNADAKVTLHPLYAEWLESKSRINQMELIRRNKGLMYESRSLRHIQIAFPNFSDIASTTIIDIMDSPNNIYFNIKYAIWVWCVDRGGIAEDDTLSYMNCYFSNGTLDACDRNGWTLDTFDINTTTLHNPDLKIKDFMIKCGEQLSEIIFVPRGIEKTNFVKNKIYGRNDLSIIYRAVDLYRDRFKDVCKTTISLGYCGKRKVQGDGNCYYTSFIFNLLEYAFFSKNLQIILNIIDALKSVRGDIQDFIQIGNNYMDKEEMETKYNSMIVELENLLRGNLVLDIFSLERLFNKQTPSGDPDGIFIPLIYGCRLLLYRYIVDNANRVQGYGIERMVTDLLERIRDSHNMSTADPILLLLMGEDIEYIVEIPFFAYIFKCKQRGINTPNDGPNINIDRDANGSITKIYELDEIITYDEYKDPYSFTIDLQDGDIPPNPTFNPISEDVFIGIVNCILVKGHYDIIYHSNNVPNPIPRISPIFKELITDGYYADVGMQAEDIPDYLTVDNLVNSLLQVKAANVLDKLPLKLKNYTISLEGKVPQFLTDPIPLKRNAQLKSDTESLEMESSQILAAISDDIIIKALDTMPTADINKLIACKSIKVNSYAEIEDITDEMILDMMILTNAASYVKKDKLVENSSTSYTTTKGESAEKYDDHLATIAYANLDTSWIIEDYLLLFEKYRKQQYLYNITEFSTKINTYFSNIKPVTIEQRQRNGEFGDLLHRYTTQLIRDMELKLRTENTCNILIIGALEGETNNNTFIAPISENGKKINFIYCDVGLITDISSNYSGYDYKKIYIKYILDKNSFQIFSDFDYLHRLYGLSNIFDYITFDTGVIGGILINHDPLITIDILIDKLYPLLKQDGKIYIENVMKTSIIDDKATMYTYTNEDMSKSVHGAISSYQQILPSIRTQRNAKFPPPGDFEKIYNDWVINANKILQNKNIKISIFYEKDTNLNKYINPLIKDVNYGYAIGISFQPLVS